MMTTQPKLTKATKGQNAQSSVRTGFPIYWRKLIEVGVPINEAQIIGWAIARYDIGRQLPSPAQQELIQEYCRFVCRAGLWRGRLYWQILA